MAMATVTQIKRQGVLTCSHDQSHFARSLSGYASQLSRDVSRLRPTEGPVCRVPTRQWVLTCSHLVISQDRDPKGVVVSPRHTPPPWRDGCREGSRNKEPRNEGTTARGSYLRDSQNPCVIPCDLSAFVKGCKLTLNLDAFVYFGGLGGGGISPLVQGQFRP